MLEVVEFIGCEKCALLLYLCVLPWIQEVGGVHDACTLCAIVRLLSSASHDTPFSG